MKHLLLLLFFTILVPKSNAGSPLIWGSEGTAKALNQNGIQLNDGTIFDGDDNVIKNAKAEVDTTGWATYADTAGTEPVDCTGGTANTTFTTSSSSPLRGNQSFLITKSTGASRQGEGVSYGYTVSGADLAKTLAISLDVEIDDADYDAGDLAVYIYDVDTSTLITPAYTDVSGANYKFQTIYTPVDTTSTSYRICFHIADSETNAWNAKIDNIKVGPELAAQGVPRQDWISYSPTIVGCGTTTNETFKYKRSGDSIFIYGDFTTGTCTATELQIPLPNGLTINTDVADFIIKGYMVADRAAATSRDYTLLATEGDSFLNVAENTDSSNPTNPINGSTLVNSTRYTFFTDPIPISSFAGSSVNLSVAKAEYASNSDTATGADDTTDFEYGPAGQSIVSISSANAWIKKRIRRLTSSQPIDVNDIYVSPGNNKWFRATSVFPPIDTGTAKYGIRPFNVSANDTDVDVGFGGDGATQDEAWSAYTSWKWYYGSHPGVIQTATPYGVGNAEIALSAATTRGGSSSGETEIINFSTTEYNNGSGFTVNARTTTTAQSITINETGLYSLFLDVRTGTASWDLAITKNAKGSSDPNGSGSDETSTSVDAFVANVTDTSIVLAQGGDAGASEHGTISTTVRLNKNDVVRFHSSATTDGGGNSFARLEQLTRF